MDAIDNVEHRVGRLAKPEELQRVHSAAHIRAIGRLSRAGGGMLGADTYVSRGTYDAARGAAGAGLVAIDRLRAHPAYTAAFVISRPPGHHATRDRAGGFCIFNNVAVAAAELVDHDQRVAIIDWDAHHGDGTQDIFWHDRRVLYVSIHQEDLYPGTGYAHERGAGPGNLTTVNLPMPARTTGDSYLSLMNEIVQPVVARFGPTWVLVSAGFDAHVGDPLANMALESQDFALMTRQVRAWAPGPARTVLFLEGGYDLGALETSARAVLTALTRPHDAGPIASTGGPGELRVHELARIWAQ